MRATIRRATTRDLDVLASLWSDVWHESHRDIVPAALLPHRTRIGFRRRLSRKLDDCLVCESGVSTVGFATVARDGGELEQLFIARCARGQGVALQLLRQAEVELVNRGASVGHLFALARNVVALRFYERAGWTRGEKPVMFNAEIESGTFPLECYRFERAFPEQTRDSALL